ncbi:MAG: carboxypeptidase regulatory-like domain-containing protein [Chitinophagaceae bacterium]|nr:carboxypeptidase regulatory-like domain-containing protein [Chitinophagaceae bacterium]
MAKQTYNISGVIKDNSKKGISNLRVEAWDKDLLIDDFVGEATTDKNGKFKIGFTVKRFRELFLDRKPDIFFKVYSGEILLHSTEQSVVWNMAEDQDNIEIILSTNSDKNVIEEKSSGFTLTGMVKHLSGNPVAGINVVVSEKMLRSSKRLANTTTDSSGIYSFSLENQIPKTAYSVEVKGADGKILASAEFLLNKIESITQDFTIEDPQYKGTPLFKLNQPVLNKYLEQLKKGGEKKPLSIDDVNFVANQVGTEPRDTFHWLRANEMEAVTAIPAEAFMECLKVDFQQTWII